MGKFLVLKKRKDFLRVAKDITVIHSHVMLQAAHPIVGELNRKSRIGFTATKRIGKAYYRNLTKRRLRAVVRELYDKFALDNVDYVLVGRRDTAVCPFEKLLNDTRHAFKKANRILKKAPDEKNSTDSD